MFRFVILCFVAYIVHGALAGMSADLYYPPVWNEHLKMFENQHSPVGSQSFGSELDAYVRHHFATPEEKQADDDLLDRQLKAMMTPEKYKEMKVPTEDKFLRYYTQEEWDEYFKDRSPSDLWFAEELLTKYNRPSNMVLQHFKEYKETHTVRGQLAQYFTQWEWNEYFEDLPDADLSFALGLLTRSKGQRSPESVIQWAKDYKRARVIEKHPILGVLVPVMSIKISVFQLFGLASIVGCVLGIFIRIVLMVWGKTLGKLMVDAMYETISKDPKIKPLLEAQLKGNENSPPAGQSDATEVDHNE